MEPWHEPTKHRIIRYLLWTLIIMVPLLIAGGAYSLFHHNKAAVVSNKPSNDTYVSQAAPNQSFRDDPELAVNFSASSSEIAYIKFNLAGVNGMSVKGADLSLYPIKSFKDTPVDVYLVPKIVDTNTVTWRTKPDLAGAQKIGSLPSGTASTYSDVKLNQPVWTDGPVELALVATTNKEVRFASFESDNKPDLLIDAENQTVQPLPPVITITANPDTVVKGGSTTISWTSTNAPDSCTADGDWSGIKQPYGSETISNLNEVRDYSFNLLCTNSSGSDVEPAQVSVTTKSAAPADPGVKTTTSSPSPSPSPTPAPTPSPPPSSGGGGTTVSAPVVSISANPSSIVAGNSTTLTWSSTNSPTSCTASGDWSGAKASSGSASSGTLSTTKTYTYNLACSNSAGTGNANVSVVVNATGGGGQVVGVPYVCTGPVNNLIIRGTGNTDPALINLKSGCTGSLSFDITVSAGADGVKVQQGAHDLNITSGSIVCTNGQEAGSHQDGVQVQGGTNVTFHNLTVSCPNSTGAGAFYIDGKDFSGINNVICDGCDLKHFVIAYIFTTGDAPVVVNSGVRNSILHMSPYQGNQCWTNPQGGSGGMVNDNNTCVP